MPVPSLSKFGVPTGDASNTRGNLLMPKLKYRFRVRFVHFGPVAGGIDLTRQVISCGKPSIGYEAVQLDAYNSRAYVHGKHTWEAVQCTVRDDITNTVSRLIGHQVQKQVNHFEQTAFAAGMNYKFTTMIEIMDGGNTEVFEQWVLEGCFLENVAWGDLDYATSEAQTIQMTIRYDNATQSGGLMTETPEMSVFPGSLIS